MGAGEWISVAGIVVGIVVPVGGFMVRLVTSKIEVLERDLRKAEQSLAVEQARRESQDQALKDIRDALRDLR